MPVEIDLRTLVLILGVTHFIQFLVFFHQFKINKTYNGVGWWLMWSAAEVIGFGAMLHRSIPSLLSGVIIVQNSMIVAGTVFLYIGVRRFLDKNVNFRLLITVVLVFFTGLLYFLFIENNIQIRAGFISGTLAILSFFTAHSLLVNKPRSIKASANFNGVIFIVHGSLFAFLTVAVLLSTPEKDFFTAKLINILPFFDALIVSLLWTFGLIIMLNQRLHTGISEANEELQLIFNTSPDAAMISHQGDGAILDVNKGYTTITGYDREDLAEKSTLDLNIWKNLADRQKMIDILRNKGYCDNFEAQFVRKDGTVITGLLSARTIDLQGVPIVISITRDITERKINEAEIGKLLKISERSRKDLLSILEDQMQAQEALKDSSKKWQTTFDGMRDSVFLLDTDGMILQTNKISQQILGKKEEEIIGHHCYEVMHNTPSCIDGCPLVRMRQSNQRETMVLSTDGKWFEIIVDPILDDDNKLTGAVHLICDITERMEVQEKIRKLYEELEQRILDRTFQLEASNKELEAFSYSVSHDLRAPLRHISGYVEMLNRHFHDSLPGKGKHYLDTITDSAHQMGVLIDDLLQFSRTGRQEMQQHDLDMNAVLQEALKINQQELSGRSIEWFHADLPHVYGDRSLLRLVWINLLSNAVKFTRGKKKARIETGFREENKEYLFFVRDNGAGFDMQYAQKLFGVFQRLHSSEEFEGTGIGLANVRRIILKHGGRTWAESELDKGATFYFTLPK
jgi:PAS domain S-box-containing protein